MSSALMLALLSACQSTPPEESRFLDWSAEGPGLFENASEPPPTEPSAQTGEQLAIESAPLANEWYSDSWVALARFAKDRRLGAPRRLGNGFAAGFELLLPQGYLVLTPGKQAMKWQGMDVYLGFAPQFIKGELFVHQADLLKTIEPLLSPAKGLLSQQALVVIDPGHGGLDTGAKSSFGGASEKDLALDWAVRLKGILDRSGVQAVLTRSTDSDLALSNRVMFALSLKPTLFVSLHFNSAPGNQTQTQGGVETYCLTPRGLPSTVTRDYPDDLNARFDNNEFDVQNLLWACRVHEELLKVRGTRDRGVRKARFMGVLRGQKQPAILVEGGYLSDREEARLIQTAAHRQALAQAVARAILAQRPGAEVAAQLPIRTAHDANSHE